MSCCVKESQESVKLGAGCVEDDRGWESRGDEVKEWAPAFSRNLEVRGARPWCWASEGDGMLGEDGDGLLGEDRAGE